MGQEKEYFTAFYDLAKVINASLEPERVFSEITRCVAEAMGVKACSLRLLDSRREKLLWAAAYGLSEGYIRKGAVVVKESGLDRKALLGSSVYLGNAQTDADFQYKDQARAEGIKSVLVVPLMLEDRAIGVMRVYTGKVRKFNQQEVKFLESAANLSAIAIENTRLHQRLRTDFDLALEHLHRLDDN